MEIPCVLFGILVAVVVLGVPALSVLCFAGIPWGHPVALYLNASVATSMRVGILEDAPSWGIGPTGLHELLPCFVDALDSAS